MTQTNNPALAAIALAMQDFLGENVHDLESGIITIKARNTLWNARQFCMTELPK